MFENKTPDGLKFNLNNIICLMATNKKTNSYLIKNIKRGNMIKVKGLTIPIVFVFLLIGIGMVNIVAADGNSMHIYYNSNYSGFWNIDQYMWVEKEAPNTFWAMQWWFEGTGDAGYVGIMSIAGDYALFSLWNANAASGPNCGTFTGEGDGYHCSIRIHIDPYTFYKFRVWRLDSDPKGQWWGAWISGGSINNTFIGAIRVDSSNTLMTIPLDFTEYPGVNQCSLIPRSIVNWIPPTFNNNDYNSTYANSDTPCNSDFVISHNYISAGMGDE